MPQQLPCLGLDDRHGPPRWGLRAPRLEGSRLGSRPPVTIDLEEHALPPAPPPLRQAASSSAAPAGELTTPADNQTWAALLGESAPGQMHKGQTMVTLPPGLVREDCPVDVASESTSPICKNKMGHQDSIEPHLLLHERIKSTMVGVLVFVTLGSVVFALMWVKRRVYKEPVCPTDKQVVNEIRKCDVCAKGTILMPLGGNMELEWPYEPRAVLYFFGLVWCFLGVGIICDQFMAAIEEITSSERVVWMKVTGDTRHKFHIRVWNRTMANLTLMAFGSSAPEILLACIELYGNDMFTGELGPSTIVGSAAFNLLVIPAVCIASIPANETRYIRHTVVYAVTATSSILAYVWLVVILRFNTPDKVDLWEAVVTLATFPVLLSTAFIADKGWCARCSRRCVSQHSNGVVDEAAICSEQLKLQKKYNKAIAYETVKMMLEIEAESKRPKHSSHATSLAHHRKNIMQSVSGTRQQLDRNNNALLFGFERGKYTVLECGGTVRVTVRANRPPPLTVAIKYSTRDGVAKAGTRYKSTEGTLRFDKGVMERHIDIQIIDNETWNQEEEDFFVVLSDLSVEKSPQVQLKKGVALGRKHTAVVILDDDDPGTLGFAVPEVMIQEGVPMVTLAVVRSHGVCGDVSCLYETVDGTALDTMDYEKVCGRVVMRDGQRTASIMIPINAETRSDQDRLFRVVLRDASTGVKFDRHCDGGGSSSSACEVVIKTHRRMFRGVYLFKSWWSRRRWRLGCKQWAEQFPAAFYCGGTPEDQRHASMLDWLSHILALFWKVVFATVPPPVFGGGWLCFFVSLAFIAGVTAVIADIAGLLGCVLRLPDNVTAITLVALGTSLPDTFASRSAARQDESADNAIGNVTGSNSVNVFVGLGLPWTIGAMYWRRGKTDEWREHKHNGRQFEAEWGAKYPGGGFLVPSDSLVFSVFVFSLTAIACIVLLHARRLRYGGELGGPKSAQRRDGAILLFLWLIYLGASIVNNYLPLEKHLF